VGADVISMTHIAKRFDELNARRHLLPAQRDGRLLVAEKRRLRRDDVEIGVDARAVPRRGDPQVPGRRLDRRILLLDLASQDPQRRKVVLDLLKRGQHRSAIAGNRLVE